MRYLIKLRTSILCIVLLAVIPSVILIVINGLEERARVLNETHQRAYYQSEHAAQQVSQLVEGLRHILMVISRESIITNVEPRPASIYLIDIMKHLPHVANLGVTDARGIVVASAIPVMWKVDLSERLYVKKALRDDAFVCGVYQVGKITGIETVNFAYPLRDADSKPRGVVYAALDLKHFQNVLGSITLPPGADVTVLDVDGRILYSRLSSIHRTGELFPAAQHRFDSHGDPSTVSVAGLDTVQRIYTVRAVSSAEGLFVLVGLPEKGVLAAARLSLTRNLILLGAVAALALGLAWLLGNLLIMRRVNAMIRAFDDIAAGNLSARSGLVHDSGELGQMANSFDTMALSLQKRDNELRDSQEKFHALFHYSPVPLVLSSYEDNLLIDVNRVFCELFGFSSEEVIGKKALDLGLLDNRTQQECFEILTARGRVSAYPTTIRTKSCDVLNVLWSADIITIDGRVCLISSAVDVTERKAAEAALHRSEDLLRSVINQTSAFMGLLDTTGRVIYTNETSLKFAGVTLDEFAGKYFWECPSWPDRRVAKSMLETAIHDVLTGKPVRREVEQVDKKGARRIFDFTLSPFIDEDGSVVYLIPEGRDVTEILEIGKQLREEIHFNQLLLNTSPALIVAIGMDGKVMMMNRAMLELLEYCAEEVVGKDYLDTFVPAKDRDDVNTIFDCLAHNNASTINSNTILSKSGKIFPVEWHGQSVQSQDGCNEFFVGVGIDITEREAAEKEREKIQLQLVQAQKMESVGRLAGGVAHDFNNMLSVILGHVDLAFRREGADRVLSNDLLEIRKAAERSADLTRQLLAFARKQTINPRVIDLNTTVAGMLKMLQRLIGEDIDLAWLPGKNLWPVKLDPGQLDQILANLFVNARDAIAGDGKITIETGTAVLDKAYCNDHAGFVPGEFVLLTVSDNGCGMERQTMEHIFEPFFTTKDLDKGTGLGLATVYGIIKQNDGFINVYSEAGQGTTFRLYLRRHQGASEPAPAQAAEAYAARGSETILLVEDEASILKMTTQMLDVQGYRVLAACTPGEALRVAEEHRGEIHLLMTDVVMPGMNGRELANKLQSLYPGLKRLFMSGYTADVIIHHGVLEEGVCFIQKPFSLVDLAARVREALER